MSRTGLDAADLAQSLRSMAGDGGIEWVTEPMQASGLLDIADALDENAKLRELVRDMLRWMPCHRPCSRCERYKYPIGCEFERRRLELGIEVVE